MQWFSQWLIAGWIMFNFISATYYDFNDCPAEKATGFFPGFIGSLGGSILIWAVFYFAGAFDILW